MLSQRYLLVVSKRVLFRLAVMTSDPRNPEVLRRRRVAVGWVLAASRLAANGTEPGGHAEDEAGRENV